MLEFINLNEINAKGVVFAGDFSVACNLNSIKDYWDKLTAIGPKYCYFPKPTKPYLIVKENKLMEKQKLFANSRVNKKEGKRQLSEGKRQLGAIIGSTEYCDEYMKHLVKDRDNQLTILSTIAEKQPQASYLACDSGFKSKLNYFLRTTPNIRH